MLATMDTKCLMLKIKLSSYPFLLRYFDTSATKLLTQPFLPPMTHWFYLLAFLGSPIHPLPPKQRCAVIPGIFSYKLATLNGEGGLLNNLEHDSNDSVILHIKCTFHIQCVN